MSCGPRIAWPLKVGTHQVSYWQDVVKISRKGVKLAKNPLYLNFAPLGLCERTFAFA